MMDRILPCVVAVAAITAMVVGLCIFEAGKVGIRDVEYSVGSTPITVYRADGRERPLVIIAHGFSGSRAMVQGLALTLAHAGYHVATLDFPGHGDHPGRLSWNFTLFDAATRQLENTISAVINAELVQTSSQTPVALIGHSMATDVIVRLAARDARVGPLVAISMYSDAITATSPRQMLAVSGEFEPGLRNAALEAARLVDTGALEDEIVESADGGIRRGALVAPGVEHVGVLYSPVTHDATVDWLNAAYGRSGVDERKPIFLGWSILLTLAGGLALFWPVSRLLGLSTDAATQSPTPWAAVLAPPIITPVMLWPLTETIIPMPGMTYLTAHFAVYGLLALALLWRVGIRPALDGWRTPLLLIVYAVGVIAALIDWTFTDFLPSGERLLPLAGIALGAIPFMIADSLLLKARNMSWWLRFAVRLLYFGSLVAGLSLVPETRLIIGFFFPVFLLFFLVFGLMARWLEKRQPAPAMTGAAQGFLLAYALAATVPLIESGVG